MPMIMLGTAAANTGRALKDFTSLQAGLTLLLCTIAGLCLAWIAVRGVDWWYDRTLSKKDTSRS